MSTKSAKKDDVRKAVMGYTAPDPEFDRLETENKLLRETISQMQAELIRYQQPALMVCEIADADLEKRTATIRVPNGNQFFVNITAACGPIAAGDTVLCEQKNLTVIRKIETIKKFDIEQFVIIEKPKIAWKDIGGLKHKVEEVREVLELPLQKPELFKKIGIEPPKGVLLYGPPGTGKTLLAKAVAASTNSTFIEIVGSELVQKFIGEGAKLVKEVFQLARDRAPSIIFVDEIDSLAAKRIEIGTSGEREVQRTFMQLLAELDGFTPLDNVKIVGATNRKDILDPAILRPGRLDRHIHVTPPEGDGIIEVFKIHMRNMKLAKDVNLQNLIKLVEGFSGAEIKAVCTEAGYFAIRENKVVICQKHLTDAIEKVKLMDEYLQNHDETMMFG